MFPAPPSTGFEVLPASAPHLSRLRPSLSLWSGAAAASNARSRISWREEAASLSVRRRRRKIGEFFLLPLEYSKEFPEIELYGGVARELLCRKELEGGGEKAIGKGGEIAVYISTT